MKESEGHITHIIVLGRGKNLIKEGLFHSSHLPAGIVSLHYKKNVLREQAERDTQRIKTGNTIVVEG